MQLAKSLVLAALATAPCLAQCLTFPNPQPGTDLGLYDDSGYVVTLPFAFPFNGQNYTQLSICSNGYIWLGAQNGPWDYTDSEAEFLAQAPRIAPCWDDWNPGAGGGVFYLADASSAHVVWKGVPHFGASTLFANMEVVLQPSGVIIFAFDATMSLPNSTSITGITAGNGAPASPLVWTTYPAVANATGYELNAANAFPLAGTTMLLAPTSATGYASTNVPGGFGACPPLASYPPLATSASYGSGCPNPTSAPTGTLYEEFPNTAIDLSNLSILFTALPNNQFVALAGPGFDTSYGPGDALPQGDDTLASVSTASMGGFPFLGSSYASLGACSNGFLWVQPNPGAPFSASALDFATDSARIAPAWGDWNFNIGGTFYWTATASYCMATWENVAAYGQAGTQNTFQAKLFPNGDIVFSYGAILNNSVTGAGVVVSGLSGGGSVLPTAAIDLSAVLATPVIGDLTPFTLLPLAHSVAAPPVLGNGYGLQASSIPAGTVIGAFLAGFTQFNPGLDLTALGMPGCFQYTTADFVTVQVVAGGTMSFTIPIPASIAFAGLALNSQAATFSGFTPLGVITSNGVQGLIGL